MTYKIEKTEEQWKAELKAKARLSSLFAPKK